MQYCSRKLGSSIHLFNCWTATSTWRGIAIHTSRHATLGHPTTTCSLVDFHHDWVHNSLQLFLLCLKLVLFSKLVLVQPIQGFLNCRLDLVFVITLELLLLQSVAHCEAVVLKTVLSLNLALVLFILITILLCLLNHTVNLRLRQTALLISDGDLI